jgi:hypothetical protein
MEGIMETNLKTLFIDTGTSFYRTNHYKVGNFFGPVDLGLLHRFFSMLEWLFHILDGWCGIGFR